MTHNFLNNPLETFKSFVYDFNFFNLYSLNNQNVMGESLFNWNDSFTNTLETFTIFNGEQYKHTLFLTLIIFYYYIILIKDIKSFWLTFFSVIIFHIFFNFFNVQIFESNIFVIDYSTYNIEQNMVGIKTINTSNWISQSGTSVFCLIFFKEFLSFISIFLLWWILESSSLTDTKLIPHTILEILDELIYKKNLILFSDTLKLKQTKDVKQFQELFIKVHGLLLFILIANVQGMVSYTNTITSSLLNTFYLALAVFINILIILFKEKGVSHFFSLFLPQGCPFNLIFLLGPIEFISYSFRLISLSVRLFANMMAGHTLMKVIAGFSLSLMLLGDFYIFVHYLPFVVLFLLTFLEIAVAFIQTYIFVILVYIYLTDIFVGH